MEQSKIEKENWKKISIFDLWFMIESISKIDWQSCLM